MTGSTSGFRGFGTEAVDFYQALEADNTKDWWTAHKDVYESAVRRPMEALLAELEPQFGPGKVFRPYRDTRFSADKTPYKTHQGAFVAVAEGLGYYVQLDADGLYVGGGFHHHASDQVARYRAAVDAADTGGELAGIVGELEQGGMEIGGEMLKTRPRGIPEDHPRLELLRHKSLTAGRRLGVPGWLGTRRTLSRVRAEWDALRPLVDWIERNVGASTEEPRRRF
jgi:uncharacterized protein (TIGR02453 family)